MQSLVSLRKELSGFHPLMSKNNDVVVGWSKWQTITLFMYSCHSLLFSPPKPPTCPVANSAQTKNRKKIFQNINIPAPDINHGCQCTIMMIGHNSPIYDANGFSRVLNWLIETNPQPMWFSSHGSLYCDSSLILVYQSTLGGLSWNALGYYKCLFEPVLFAFTDWIIEWRGYSWEKLH